MLEGKFVSCRNLDMLKFCYPSYEIVDKVTPDLFSKKFIYVGKYYPSILDDCSMLTRNFILLCGSPEISLLSRLDWLNFIYSKYNKSVSKQLQSTYEQYSEDEFWNGCKYLWVTGKWPYQYEKDKSVYKMFEASNHSLKELLSLYFDLKELNPYIDYSFLTFLKKVNDVDIDSAISTSYKKVILTLSKKVGKKIPQSVDLYFTSKHEQVKFLQFLLNLFLS